MEVAAPKGRIEVPARMRDEEVANDAHLAKRPRCSSCMAFNPLKNECRRNCPAAVPVPVPDPQRPGETQLRAYGIWPATLPTNWCAQWIAELPKAGERGQT